MSTPERQPQRGLRIFDIPRTGASVAGIEALRRSGASDALIRYAERALRESSAQPAGGEPAHRADSE